MWITCNMRFPKLKYIFDKIIDIPPLNWPSVEDFITSFGNTFHLQMASWMDYFLKISSLHFGTLYFSSFRVLYIVNFLENWQ